MESGVSARDMSLSLGMSENYINSLENGKLVPSLEVFDYICDFLKISYKDFFDEDKTNPSDQNDLIKLTAGLQNTQIDNLKEIAQGLQLLNRSK